MIIKIYVFCTNASGEADILPVKVECTQRQYDLGSHYITAEEIAGSMGYERPYVVADENDSAFQWVLASKAYWPNMLAVICR